MQTKPPDDGIFGPFSNFDKCRPQGAGGVISGAAFDFVDIDVAASFGDSRFYNSLIIILFVRPYPLCALLCRI